MESIKLVLETVGIKAGMLFGGFVGAVISLKFVKAETNWEKIIMVASGTVAAIYGTQVLAYFVTMTESTQNGASFFLGVYGMGAMHEIYSMIQSGELKAWVKKLLGLGG